MAFVTDNQNSSVFTGNNKQLAEVRIFILKKKNPSKTEVFRKMICC